MKIRDFSKGCELVIGLVAPVGVNLDDVNNKISSYFGQFDYELNFIHLSKVASSACGEIKAAIKEHERIDKGMNLGNYLRERAGRADILALIAMSEINGKREDDDNNKLKPLGRVVHVVRSLKHPDEVEAFRQVYGHGFFLLGISSSLETRINYLKNEKGVPEDEVDRLIDRDDKEKGSFGQNTRGVFQLSDAFVTFNDSSEFSKQLARTFDIMFSKPVVSPSADEYAMFMAYAASLRSADLSRQVGAVITSTNFDILSTGANDVPKFGGGLYWPGDDDQRDHVKGFDTNEEQKNKIVINIMKRMNINSVESDDELLKEGRKILKDTGLLDITEYGRAVHAEMEALLSAARNGMSTKGSTLYTTTFPCHNCAKHIVAAGVKKVKYIEPYPKSYATKLHDDAISTDGDSVDNKVLFEPFIGIGPRRFVDLFSMSLGSGRELVRKEFGRLKTWTREGAELRVPMVPLSYVEAETILSSEIPRDLISGEALND